MALSARYTRPLALLLALMVWFALVLQFWLALQQALANGKTLLQGVVIYFGFFTILTNLLVALTLTLPMTTPRSAPGRFFARPSVIAGVAVSIALVGLVYHLLLRGLVQLHGLNAFANTLLHYVMPIGFVIYAWLVLRGAMLRWAHPLLWSGYLIAYFVYVLIRGTIVDTYPYPFIDVTSLGYATTFVHGCLMLVAFLVIAFVFVALIKLRDRLDRA